MLLSVVATHIYMFPLWLLHILGQQLLPDDAQSDPDGIQADLKYRQWAQINQGYHGEGYLGVCRPSSQPANQPAACRAAVPHIQLEKMHSR